MKSKEIVETTDQFNQFTSEINQLLQDGLTKVAYKKYANLILNIEKREINMSDQLKADIFASFAYFLFELQEYNNFIGMLYKAQQYGYSRDEIKEVLWEGFIEPNIKEFQAIYEANILYLNLNEYTNLNTNLDFHDLPFWLVPTGIKNEFYLYDKEKKLISEKLSLSANEGSEELPVYEEFSDYLLIENGNLETILSLNKKVKERSKKTYVLLKEVGKFLSCMQGSLLNKEVISDVLIFDSLESLVNYFKGNNVYLPRNIMNIVDSSNETQNYLNEVHKYRIKRQENKRDNILISICIPSFNRGDRAYENIMNLLQLQYDEEVEFIVSNNGSQNDTKKYYEKIMDIEDSRVKYFSFEENQGFTINVTKVCELAEGKYILLLSDEDFVDFNSLDKIMEILIQSKGSLSVLRTSSTTQNKLPNQVENAGKDAILTFMLSSNYMSGIIFNNRLLKQYKGVEYVKQNLGNAVCLFYPHVFFELLLLQYGSAQGTNLLLINEGIAEKTEIGEKEELNSKVEISYYATIEGRLDQHKGFSEIFNMLEICKSDQLLHREMYIRLCIKTLYLVRLSITTYYNKVDTDIMKVFEEAYTYCTRREFFVGNRRDFKNDIIVINKNYEYLKSQL